jgi:hypothetical protein
MNIEENMQSCCLLYPNIRPVGKVGVYHRKTRRQTDREESHSLSTMSPSPVLTHSRMLANSIHIIERPVERNT